MKEKREGVDKQGGKEGKVWDNDSGFEQQGIQSLIYVLLHQ